MFVLSHVNLLHIDISKKWLLMRFILLEALERTVRFLTTVGIVLEGDNSCLSNNKWLGAKHVSTVFG